MRTLLQDLRYGWRMLARKPGFTAVAVLTLALGIGANTAIFSAVNAVLLRPLPFPDAGKLVTLWESNLQQDEAHGSVGSANFSDWRNQNRVFESLAAYTKWNYNLTGKDEPYRVQAALVSGDFFRTLGVQPTLGRGISAEDDQPGKDFVVVLSHAFWQSRFGANQDIIGQAVTLNSKSFTVIGVMPGGFGFPDKSVELWSPLGLTPQQAQSRQGKWLKVIGRLKAGVTLEQARAEMSNIAAGLERQYPEFNGGSGVSVIPLHDEVVGAIKPVLSLLLVAVGFTLLIACANVANITLAHATARRREMAVRYALGASRWRVARQLFTESFLLAVLGGAAGLLLAYWGVDFLLALSPPDLPRLDEVGIDARVLAFTLGLSLLTAMAFGLSPAIQAARVDLNEALKQEGRGSGSMRGRKFRGFLVIAEVAAGVLLLICAGLLIRSFVRLQNVNSGFNAENILTMRVTLPAAKYRENQQQIAFFQQALENIQNTPGVVAAGAVQDLPLGGNSMAFKFSPADLPAPPENQKPKAAYRAVTPDYFSTMGMPVVQGRRFTPQDNSDSPPVLVINQTMARHFWPGEDPIGKQVRFGEPEIAWQIIGVVGDVKHNGLDAEEGPVIYQAHAQKQFSWLNWMAIVVRTKDQPTSLAAAVQRQIQALDKDQPVYGVAAMDQLLSRSVAQPRFSALLLGLFSLLAMSLAVVGIYGVVSYSVAQRTHEIGIRLALGAQAHEVLKLVIRQGMKLALIGVAAGLAAAFAMTRAMSSLLFGVGATDPLTFAVVTALLTAVALLACYLPARRAAKVDPMVALRYE